MSDGLTIGIDARAADEVPAGKGRYVRELLRALAARDDAHTYVLFGRTRWDEPLDQRFTWWLKQAPDGLWHRTAAHKANESCDVFLATASYVTPWFLSIPSVLVIHDLVVFRRDAHASRRAALVERLTIRRALHRSTRVVCDSESTRRDLLRRFPAAAPKSVTVHLAASPRFREPVAAEQHAAVRERYGLDRPFVLCTGTLEPRKNLLRVIEAFARLPSELREAHLLALAGPRGWEYERILERPSELGAAVRVLGHIPDDDLVALYQSCEVFCYPSLYEGFGLPVLEALTAGAPTITSSASSLPEVGGDAVRFVNPFAVGEIRDALRDLLTSPAERELLRAAGPNQAARFSWERAAAGTLGQLTEAARQGPAHRRR